MLIVSINVLPKTCVNCGAPLKEPLCLYCDTDYSVRPASSREEIEPAVRSQFGVRIRSHEYQLQGLLARGAHSEVYLARRKHLLREQIVLKVSQQDALLNAEWEALKHLEGRNDYLARLMPIPVGLTRMRGRTVLGYRWRSGFVHTLRFAREQYRGGLPAEATVWIWSRILEQLECLQDLGYSHNNLTLENCLVHPRDHGIALCGWSRARLGEGQDLAASGRLVNDLLGKAAPGPLKELARSAHQFYSPYQLQEEVVRVARSVFGPPKFQPFVLR